MRKRKVNFFLLVLVHFIHIAFLPAWRQTWNNHLLMYTSRCSKALCRSHFGNLNAYICKEMKLFHEAVTVFFAFDDFGLFYIREKISISVD